MASPSRISLQQVHTLIATWCVAGIPKHLQTLCPIGPQHRILRWAFGLPQAPPEHKLHLPEHNPMRQKSLPNPLALKGKFYLIFKTKAALKRNAIIWSSSLSASLAKCLTTNNQLILVRPTAKPTSDSKSLKMAKSHHLFVGLNSGRFTWVIF